MDRLIASPLVVISPLRHESQQLLHDLFLRAHQNAPRMVLLAAARNTDRVLIAVSCDPPRTKRSILSLGRVSTVLSPADVASLHEWLVDGGQLWLHVDTFETATSLANDVPTELRAALWFSYRDAFAHSFEDAGDVAARSVCWAELVQFPHGFERGVADVSAAGWLGVALPCGEWSPATVAMAHKFGLLAVARMANRRHVVDEALYAGVDVVIGDDADMLHAAVQHALR